MTKYIFLLKPVSNEKEMLYTGRSKVSGFM